jgi:transposase
MRVTDPASCTNCLRLQARVDAPEAELAALKQLVAQLAQQLASARNGSSTSSKPPSSDIVKPPRPPPPEGQDRRRIGGHPGHPEHQRVASEPEAINGGSTGHRLDSCPCCGHDLQPALTIPPRAVRRIDIAEVPLPIQEHRSHPAWCPHCRVMHRAPLPPGIGRGGLVGPTLTTLIAYLKGACHASSSTARKSLRDVAKVTTSRGELARIIAKVGRALEQPYRELLDDLPGQAVLNVDETGPKQNGQRRWTRCFRAGLDTLFKIDPTRSADVLIGVPGAEFDGVLGGDDFSSYRRSHREFAVLLQSCLADLIRDVKYLGVVARSHWAGLWASVY